MRLLFVEDDPTTASLLPEYTGGSREIVVAFTAADADALLAPGHRFSAVVIDWVLGEDDGTELAKRLRGRGEAVPIVLVSAAGSHRFEQMRKLARELGNCEAVRKPYTVDEIEDACRRAGAVPRP